MGSLLPDHAGIDLPHLHGLSTGAFPGQRGDWAALADQALDRAPRALELAALSGDELPGLHRFLATEPLGSVSWVSVHAPVKDHELDDAALAAELVGLPLVADAIVVHPDRIADPGPFRALRARLSIENMDARKATGRTAAELAGCLAALPLARVCLDLAHAADVDPTMAALDDLLAAYGDRLSHLHISSLVGGRHAPVTRTDLDRYRPALDRCRHVPWIFEAVSA